MQVSVSNKNLHFFISFLILNVHIKTLINISVLTSISSEDFINQESLLALLL